MAICEPAVSASSGATRQNSGHLRMSTSWRSVLNREARRFDFASLAARETLVSMNCRAARMKPAKMRNVGRQPTSLTRNSVGAVETTMPRAPIAMMIELASERALEGDQQRGRLEARHEPPANPADGPRGRGRATGSSATRQKKRAAEGRDGEHRSLHPARTVTVEKHAQRKLEQAESAEIGGGQEPKLGRGQMEIRPRDRAPRPRSQPEQIGEKIAAGKRQQDRRAMHGRMQGSHFRQREPDLVGTIVLAVSRATIAANLQARVVSKPQGLRMGRWPRSVATGRIAWVPALVKPVRGLLHP